MNECSTHSARVAANDTILWSLSETARQLGGVSVRTVRRLIMRGELQAVRVGRCVRVPADVVRDWLEKNMRPAHNPECAEPSVREKEIYACHTVAKIVPFGGSATPTQAARELGVLLERPTARKQRH